jgi:hypothetical protein
MPSSTPVYYVKTHCYYRAVKSLQWTEQKMGEVYSGMAVLGFQVFCRTERSDPNISTAFFIKRSLSICIINVINHRINATYGINCSCRQAFYY